MNSEPQVETIHTGCVVIGSGIAGLSVALGHGDCVVLTKTELGEGSSRWAQGGIAAALGDDDHAGLHARDTVSVSGGLGDVAIAELVTGAAADRIAWLTELGAQFDRDETGELTLGREAGHRRHRIVHANGDSTGAEIMRALVGATRERPDIEILEHTFALDLITDGDEQNPRVTGVRSIDEHGDLLDVMAPAVVIATGGVGQVYERTTNPIESTGDGLAMALRADVETSDLEFVQFHPTALDAPIDPTPLLTEALRGAGALLVDSDGTRFMVDVHDDAELAPRDIVARNVWAATRTGEAFLDARGLGDDFPERFPTVWDITRRVGLDPREDLLPVSPAEHYHMGGIVTDDRGRTSLAGLFAAGEVASTGLHGANRLASNSLLEGLVFGQRVAQSITANADAPDAPVRKKSVAATMHQDASEPALRVAEATQQLRAVMWAKVGLVRDEQGLKSALRTIQVLTTTLASDPTGRNLATVAEAITRAALTRTDSVGSHYRTDGQTAVNSQVVPV